MIFVLLLSSILPAPSVARFDSVDLVEVNHYHDESGRKVFDQLIFYDWSPQRKRFQVVAWRLIKSERYYPRYDRRGWKCLFHDDGILREIVAKSKRETWTGYDPELYERNFLPQDQRRELSQR